MAKSNSAAADDAIADPVREAVALHHDRDRRGSDLEDDEFQPGEPDDFAGHRDAFATSQRDAETSRRRLLELLHVVGGVPVARWRPIVVGAENERAAVGVGEGRDVVGNEVPDFSPVERLTRSIRQIPEGLELEELAFLPFEETSDFRFGQDDVHGSVGSLPVLGRVRSFAGGDCKRSFRWAVTSLAR